MRLGVYADLLYASTAGSVTANRAFVSFVADLPPRVDELVLFGRLSDRDESFPHPVSRPGVRFVPLPHYGGLRDLRDVGRALPESVRVVRRELPRLDALWLFGPHPLALAFAREARRAGTPIVLGVRQDFPAYIRARAAWALPAAYALELSWRRLARSAPAGGGGGGPPRPYNRGAAVHSTGFSLIRDGDVIDRETALGRDWSGSLRLFTVGRLSPEKNPELLADVVSLLDDRWELTVVGEGPLRGRLERRSEQLGVAHRLRLEGYVPSGPALWERYRHAHAFLHVSRTEGIPQVLYEALASGLPVVATDVGGVRSAMGEAAAFVPPEDARAAATALTRLEDDAAERERLVEAGIELIARETQEQQLDAIAGFIRRHL